MFDLNKVLNGFLTPFIREEPLIVFLPHASCEGRFWGGTGSIRTVPDFKGYTVPREEEEHAALGKVGAMMAGQMGAPGRRV